MHSKSFLLIDHTKHMPIYFSVGLFDLLFCCCLGNTNNLNNSVEKSRIFPYFVQIKRIDDLKKAEKKKQMYNSHSQKERMDTVSFLFCFFLFLFSSDLSPVCATRRKDE